MMKRSLVSLVCGVTAFGAIQPALAHPGDLGATGFLLGLSHPFGGLDHLLALLAIGLWASQSKTVTGARALVAFVLCMVTGGLIGIAGPALPFAEFGTGASVVVAGLLLAAAARSSVTLGMLVIGAYGILHGWVHGMTAPFAADAGAYLLGFAGATTALYLTGGAIAGAFDRLNKRHWLRLGGIGIAGVGASLLALT